MVIEERGIVQKRQEALMSLDTRAHRGAVFVANANAGQFSGPSDNCSAIL